VCLGARAHSRNSLAWDRKIVRLHRLSIATLLRLANVLFDVAQTSSGDAADVIDREVACEGAKKKLGAARPLVSVNMSDTD